MDMKRETMMLIVRALNAWLAAVGSSETVSAADIVVTRRGNRLFLAFEVRE